MRVADLVLRYLEAVEWPVVVVLVAVLFRRSIRRVLGRLSELSGAGVSAKFQTEAERLAGRAAALSAEHDPLAASGYPRIDTRPWVTRPGPSPWDTSPSADGDGEGAWPFPYAQGRPRPPSPYTPQPSYGPPPPYGAGEPPSPHAPQSPYAPQPPYGDGAGEPPSPYAPQQGAGGPAAPVPAQPAPAEETETVVPPPPSRSYDDQLGYLPQPYTLPPGYAPGDEPSDEDEEPAPATDDTVPPPLERAHGATGESPEGGRTGSGVSGGTRFGGGAYGGGPYGQGGSHAGPGLHESRVGEGVPPQWQEDPPPPPYAGLRQGPGAAYAPARARADADPATAIRLAWTQLRSVIAGLARGHSAAPRSGVYAQVGAMGAGEDVTGLIRELDDMRRDAAAGAAPVTADAARAYVTAAEHVTAALTSTNR